MRRVVALALDHFGTQFVVFVEVVEEALVNGVEVDDEEFAHRISWPNRGHWDLDREILKSDPNRLGICADAVPA